MELGAEWIHGGCPANSLFNLANTVNALRCAEDGAEDEEDEEEVRRLYQENSELVQWPNTLGYMYTSEGEPLSEEAIAQAYRVFTSIRDEAEASFGRQRFKASGRRALSSFSSAVGPRDKSRLLTFYNTAMRRAINQITSKESSSPSSSSSSPSPALLARAEQVESALSGLKNAFTVLVGDDLEKARNGLLSSESVTGKYLIGIPNEKNQQCSAVVIYFFGIT